MLSVINKINRCVVFRRPFPAINKRRHLVLVLPAMSVTRLDGRSAVVQLSESQSQAAWTTDCEKNEDMFTLYDKIHERDGQTDGHTDTTQRHSIARQKKIGGIF